MPEWNEIKSMNRKQTSWAVYIKYVYGLKRVKLVTLTFGIELINGF